VELIYVTSVGGGRGTVQTQSFRGNQHAADGVSVTRLGLKKAAFFASLMIQRDRFNSD